MPHSEQNFAPSENFVPHSGQYFFRPGVAGDWGTGILAVRYAVDGVPEILPLLLPYSGASFY